MKEYQHVQYLDLYNNGILQEVVVVKEEINGDKYFIETESLDQVDLVRLRGILDKRDSKNYPMWDLMSQTTLRNGMNSLDYFHQLVRIKKPNGPITQPGKAGTGIVQVNVPQGK